MTTDDRLTPGLFLDVLDVLERHGYHHHNKQHTGQAMGVIRDLAHVYEGTREVPYGTYLDQAGPPETSSPGPEADKDTVTVSSAEVRIILFALDEAADYRRDRAETCAECADQSCPTCDSRLQGAQAYDRLATQMLQAAEAHAPHRDHPEPPGPGPSPDQADPAADIEAGQ